MLLLWALAGAGGAYQLAAAAAFVQVLQPSTRARAFGLAQSGLYAVQGLGILAGGAVAQAIGAPLVGSAWNPPLWAVLLLWMLAGAGGAYQLAAAAAFVQALRPVTRARASGLA